MNLQPNERVSKRISLSHEEIAQQNADIDIVVEDWVTHAILQPGRSDESQIEMTGQLMFVSSLILGDRPHID